MAQPNKKKRIKVQFLKRFMYTGIERKPEDTKKEPIEFDAQDALWMIGNGLAKEYEEKTANK